MTLIELQDDEATLFLRFRQYQEVWRKVFEIKNGSAELHFDSKGELKKIDYHTYEKLSTFKT